MIHELPLHIAADHPAFAGHFPGQPVVPAVVLLDEVLSAMAATLRIADGGWQLGSVKLRRPVRPGEALRLRFDDAAPGALRFTLACGDESVLDGAATPLPVAQGIQHAR